MSHQIVPRYPNLCKNAVSALTNYLQSLDCQDLLVPLCYMCGFTDVFISSQDGNCFLLILTTGTRDCEGIYLWGWAMAMGYLNSVTFVSISGFYY